jgi:hypothetical protein
MSTATINLQSLELVSVLHTAPANGAPSSSDYYDGELEKITDLASVAMFINNTLLPILNALPSAAATGLEGTSCYSDTANQDGLVYDSLTGNPLTITDSLRLLYGQVQTQQTLMTNLTQQVASLQARLSASNQDDIALALQNITNTQAQLAAQVRALNQSTSNLQGLVGSSSSASVLTPNITAGATESVNLLWPTAFADNTYTVSYSIEDASGYLQVKGFTYLPSGTGILVHVVNTDPAGIHQGTVQAIGLS